MLKKISSGIKIKILILALLIPMLTGCDDVIPHICYHPEDLGTGGTIDIPAKGLLNCGSEQHCTTLLRENPKEDQIIGWTPTPWRSLGFKASSLDTSYIRIYIEEGWTPWDVDPDMMPTCGYEECVYGGYQQGELGCITGAWNGENESGRTPKGPTVKKLATDDFGVKFESPITPCTMRDGMGLYMLIAKSNNGVISIPDRDSNGDLRGNDLPAREFVTTHLYTTSRDRRGVFKEVQRVENCDMANESCAFHRDPQGSGNIPSGGKIYFKIKDRHYEDNRGFYRIAVVSGVYTPGGFVEDAVSIIQSFLTNISSSLSQGIRNSVIFNTVARILLTLYIAISAFSFMLGTTNISQEEFLKRILKVSIIGLVISPVSVAFFANLQPTIVTIADDLARYFVTIGLKYNEDLGYPIALLGDQDHPLEILDIIFVMMMSKPVHAKIWSLLLTQYVYFIPMMYLAFFLVVKGVLEGLKIYFWSLIAIAFLVMLSPLFIILTLFDLTKGFFETWVKNVLRYVFLIFLSLGSLALIFNFVMNSLRDLLYFTACWTKIAEVFPSPLFHYFDLSFWKTPYMGEVQNAVTPSNYLVFLLGCLLLKIIVSQMDDLARKLSNS